MVMGNSSSSRDCGFESWCHILAGHDIFHIDLLNKLYCWVEKTKNKYKKRSGLAHLKNIWKGNLIGEWTKV